MVWGIKGVDRSGADKFNAKSLGSVEWDDSFSLESPEAQNAVKSVCNQAPENEDLDIIPAKKPSCFIFDFETWLVDVKNITYSLEGDEFTEMLKEFRSTPPFNVKFQDDIGFVDGRLRFVKVVFGVSTKRTASFIDGLPLKSEWDEFMYDKMIFKDQFVCLPMQIN